MIGESWYYPANRLIRDSNFPNRLSESEKMIVNYLADQQRVNVTDAGLVIGMDWRGTKTVLDALVTKSVISRSPGKARSRHRFYFLKRKPTGQV
jgi:ATP-dependent DNA helicase RecG